MAIYDGNQLPESPTSMFQMVVSVFYTLLVCMLMSYGAVGVLAAQDALSLDMPATQYMRRLVRKHNAVVRGVVGFIPATFSLAHLYTSSMHNGSLYSASNVFYVAIFGFATSYLGAALKELIVNATQMDAIKAVYELLFFFTRCSEALSHEPTPPKPHVQADPDEKPEQRVLGHMVQGKASFAKKAWRSSWVYFNCFLAIAALDNARLWGPILDYLSLLGKGQFRAGVLDRVPPAANSWWKSIWHWPRIATGFSWFRPASCCGYAYWLFAQDSNVYDFTGSVIIDQAIPEKLSIASYSTRDLFTAAHCFLAEFSTHFQHAIKQQQADIKANPTADFTIVCSAGNARFRLSRLLACMQRINFDNQGMNMAVERYICRLTPDYTAQLPKKQLGTMQKVIQDYAEKMFEAADALRVKGITAEKESGSFFCTLWLGYMHMVLLGVDLLRMHNNKAVFAQYKLHQAGFFEILGPDTSDAGAEAAARDSLTIKAAADGRVTAERKPPSGLDYSELYMLSQRDLRGVAAILATLLMVQRWQTLFPEEENVAVKVTAAEVCIQWQAKLGAEESDHTACSYLRKRCQLVASHSSLPAIVQGIECPAAIDWIRGLLAPISLIIACVAIVAVTFATISCSNGVFLAAISGLVQSYAAWAILMCLGQIPAADSIWQLLATLVFPAVILVQVVLLVVWWILRAAAWLLPGSSLAAVQQRQPQLWL